MKQDRLFRGMMLGMGLMYYFDPDRGRRRRAMVRDQFVHLMHRADDGLNVAARDLRNRARGVAAGAVSRVKPDHADDVVIEARVRSTLGRLTSHPGAIRVAVRDRVVTLQGPVLARERDRVLQGVKAVKGVEQVINDLVVHPSPGDVPGLQGQARTPQSRIDVLQENWSPATRLMMGILGGTLALRGVRARGMIDTMLGVAGAGLLSRALTNLEMKRLVGMDAGRRAVDIHKIITINAPIDEVFAFWSNFENFPRFMSHLREVRSTGENRSHWVAEGPGGLPFDWEAETTLFEHNRAIAWKSIGRSPIENAGLVRFQSVGNDATRIDIRMSYNPPAGAIGHVVAAFLGTDPKHLIDEDLVRLKSLLESGKTTAHHHPVIREEVSRAMRELSDSRRRGTDGDSPEDQL